MQVEPSFSLPHPAGGIRSVQSGGSRLIRGSSFTTSVSLHLHFFTNMQLGNICRSLLCVPLRQPLFERLRRKEKSYREYNDAKGRLSIVETRHLAVLKHTPHAHSHVAYDVKVLSLLCCGVHSLRSLERYSVQLPASKPRSGPTS